MAEFSSIASDAALAGSEREMRALARGITSGATTPGRTLEDAAVEFESYIMKMLLGEMRKTIGSGGLFEDRQSDGYVALLDSALADRAAQSRSLGLADQLLRQWEGRS